MRPAPAGDGRLLPNPPAAERSTTYSADVEFGKDRQAACSAQGVSFVSEPLAEDTELAGYMKLGLRVSSTSTDMDIFATLRVMDEHGKDVLYHSTTSQASPVTLGFLKVSHRKLDPARSTVHQPVHTHAQADYQPLTPNEKVQAEVELWPNTAYIKKGHRLWITIQPRDGCFAAGNNLHDYDRSYHAEGVELDSYRRCAAVVPAGSGHPARYRAREYCREHHLEVSRGIVKADRVFLDPARLD